MRVPYLLHLSQAHDKVQNFQIVYANKINKAIMGKTFLNAIVHDPKPIWSFFMVMVDGQHER